MQTGRVLTIGKSSVFGNINTLIIGGSEISFPFNIGELFENNEQGVWYDPNDLSTLFQDVNGTIPVTSVGQVIGLMLDKSGKNNHARQYVEMFKPTLQQNATTGAYYILFDGVDDCLFTTAINLTITNRISTFASVHKAPSNAGGIIAELSSASEANNGTFNITNAISTGINYWGTSSRGTTTSTKTMSTPNPAPNGLTDIAIISTNMQINTNFHEMRLNGVVGNSVASQGVGNYSNQPLYLGKRANSSIPFGGDLYGFILTSRLTTSDEVTAIEKIMSNKLGVVI